eukprot:7343725-Alexandrium_andersonii.AAC.1
MQIRAPEAPARITAPSAVRPRKARLGCWQIPSHAKGRLVHWANDLPRGFWSDTSRCWNSTTKGVL